MTSVDEVSMSINENEKQAIIDFYKNNPFRINGEPTQVKQETLQQIFKEINEDCLRRELIMQKERFRKYNDFCKFFRLKADRPENLQAFLISEKGGLSSVK